jgi:hypothetical protein
MPQIWMTYDEVADLLDCEAPVARQHAIECRLDRKKSRDGNTRVKLDHALAAIFVARIRDTDNALDRAIGELRRVHGEMARTQEKVGVAAHGGF